MTKHLEAYREPKGVQEPASGSGQEQRGRARGAIQSGIGMSRRGAEPELLLISEAVACLEAGMYGNFDRPEAVKEAKKHYPRASIGFGPQKEHAARIIDNALMKGELSVLVLPNSTEGGTPIQVPPDVLRKMIRTRGGLPDCVIQPARIFAKDPVTPELRAALSAPKSKLYVRCKEFDDWYEEAWKKRNWPSQLSADVAIAEPAATPPLDEPVTPHTGGPVPGALSAGSAIPGAMGATSVGGPNGPTLLTYSDRDLKEDIVQVGALIEISADQPLVVADVGAHRHQRADQLTLAPLRHYLAPVLLTTAALALAAVGVAINGWFSRSLGSSDAAGWLFLAVGVAADLVALVLPSCAAGLWQAGERATALVGWAVWLLTFVFAVNHRPPVARVTRIDSTDS